MLEEIKQDAKTRMQKSLDALDGELKKLRTGRAHPSLIEHITVDYYGSEVPLTQVGNVNIEDARTLAISVWEKDMAAVVEKAIINSDLGLNPAAAGQIIRVPVPPMTEERRRDLVKVVKGEGENTKIAIRNIRRDANTDVKDLLKEKEISEDQARQTEDEIQKITDGFIANVDSAISAKEAEVMEI